MIKMSKSHVHPQIVRKTSVKFQKDRTKIVGGVVLRKYPFIGSTEGLTK